MFALHHALKNLKFDRSAVFLVHWISSPSSILVKIWGHRVPEKVIILPSSVQVGKGQDGGNR